MIQDQIRQWLEEHAWETADFLSQLIKAASTTGLERPAQELMAEKLRRLGMEVDVWEQGGKELTGHHCFYSPRTEFAGSPNVVGCLKGTGGGRSLLINGHIDVVPPGEPELWRMSPWSGHIEDGKIFGRGASDMKGGTVSAILAVEALQALGFQLKGDIIIESVVEEESGGSGTLAAILRGYRADAALVPEPSEMGVFTEQQGSMWFRIAVQGRVAHGGTRYEGVSAIEKMISVIKRIEELEKQRNDRLSGAPLYRGVPIPIPINIGKIEGGSWPSSVPDLVTIEGRMGVAPSERMEEAQKELEESVLALNKVDPWFSEHPPTVEWFGARWLPGSISPDHPIMDILTDSYRKVLGKEPPVKASPWGTDGGLLTQLAGIPTVVLGPGITALAHFPNEYIELKRILEAAEIYALTIMDWCGVEGGTD
ncbi:MAG: peptidase [Desulforudis sp.]|nr:MAG: peptidase [Desulforudis sp.]